MSEDTISRQAAIEALWKALYEYEDKTEKQFQESEDLDVGDWIEHRIFVQNMNDIDRQTILNLPSAQPEIIRCKDCKHWRQQTTYQGAPLSFGFCESDDMWRSLYGETYEVSHIDTDDDFYCGYAKRRTDE